MYPCSSHQNSWYLWMFIPLKMVLIGIDPYPSIFRVAWPAQVVASGTVTAWLRTKRQPASPQKMPSKIKVSNSWELKVGYPLVICYIAIENGPFIVDLPIKNGDFPVTVRYVSLPEGRWDTGTQWNTDLIGTLYGDIMSIVINNGCGLASGNGM